MSANQENRSSRPTFLPPLREESHEPTSQQSLKNKILQIQSNKSLTPKEKAVSMQRLMMGKWQRTPTSKREEVEEEVERERQNKCFHDANQTVLGCSHYQRDCKLYTSCCKKWYCCRFCHDDNEEHEYDRYSTEKISCMHCNTIQPISNSCINETCQRPFAAYYCDVCKFHDSDPNKDIYHCDKCKICRIGKGLGIDYFHCDKCNACMSISLQEHKCVERSLESNCPICHTFMFTSTTPVMFLPCGHCMHVSCYEEYTLTNYVCPLCSKSLGDMKQYFARIDEFLITNQMPPEYSNHRAHIFCSDCERKSHTKYHFIYHKCQFEDCGSYNTKVLQQYQEESPAVEDSASEMSITEQEIGENERLSERMMDVSI